MTSSYYPEHDFSSLSVRDLLDAREAYHVQLSHLDNVVATAIGRYRIRKADPYAKNPMRQRRRPYGTAQPRTLANTVVRPWSWPCLLVFVKDWYRTAELRPRPDQAIPRTLHLPDGRAVPTCVIYAPPDTSQPPDITRLTFPTGLVGGGFPCYIESQGIEKVGTFGCLVSRSGNVYVLTNRHVAGETGGNVLSRVRGERERLGQSEATEITKLEFEKAYPGWPGRHMFVTVDAGLIRIDDLQQWTSQVFGIGEVGRLFDLYTETISLDLVGLHVRAFGAASGPLEGEIHGLFYRYRSVGGFDYVADLLIGPRQEQKAPRKAGAFSPELTSRPGDSGAIWFVDPPARAKADADKDERAPGKRARELRPIAVQWGGQRTAGRGKDPGYGLALATFLSTVCRNLDVDLVTNWNTGYSEYWGKIGHFKIGYAACELLATPKLKQLMLANQANIGFPDSDLLLGKEFRVGRGQFVPLADVPDYVWVSQAHGKGARAQARANEGNQHFADLDEVPPGGGDSLLEMCRQDRSRLSAAAWRDFYAKFDPNEYAPSPGCLPFRVRQIYDAMVDYARTRHVAEFVAAAGILAHYVADASQPLHVSALHHGNAPRVPKDSPEWEDYKKSKAYKIHSIYDEEIFERKAVELIGEINDLLQHEPIGPCDPPASRYPIERVFNLMSEASESPSAGEIVEADDPTASVPERAVLLFERFHEKIAGAIANSTFALAEMWETAWRKGDPHGEIPDAALITIKEETLQGIYNRADFLPALDLDGFVAKLGY